MHRFNRIPNSMWLCCRFFSFVFIFFFYVYLHYFSFFLYFFFISYLQFGWFFVKCCCICVDYARVCMFLKVCLWRSDFTDDKNNHQRNIKLLCGYATKFTKYLVYFVFSVCFFCCCCYLLFGFGCCWFLNYFFFSFSLIGCSFA